MHVCSAGPSHSAIHVSMRSSIETEGSILDKASHKGMQVSHNFVPYSVNVHQGTANFRARSDLRDIVLII